MTFSLSVSGSTAQAPHHPFSPEQGEAFDAAVKDFAAKLTAAGLRGSIFGSRPGTQAEYEARPRLKVGDAIDTSNQGVSLSF